jgi:predicted amidohydrolase YtcJ
MQRDFKGQIRAVAAHVGLLVVHCATVGCTESVDLIVVNANVYTVDEHVPHANAFAVMDGRFVAVGDSLEIVSRFVAPTVLDAAGRTVVPGLIDSHGHLVNHGFIRMNVDLRGTTSIAEVVSLLRERESTLPDGEWLRGRGWDQNDWAEKRFPTRGDVDPIFPDRPVWLERVDGHASLLNSAALAEMEIDMDGRTPDPVGGRIVRDAAGVATGLLIDSASDQVKDVAPEPSADLITQAIESAMVDASALGLTGVHEPGLELDTLNIYRRLVDEGKVTLRLYGMTEDLKSLFQQVCSDGPVDAYGDLLTVRAVKLYADGALGSRGASLLEDYSDDAGNRGLMRKSAAELRDAVMRTVECGLQPAVHAIGDDAVRVVLDIYEELGQSRDLSVIRPRIEHAQIVSPTDIPRFQALGVIAAMQPTHATSDMYWAEERLGADRLAGAYAWKTLIDSGTHVPFGSDFPVESVDPLKGFHAAITRQDADGYPDGGWLPQERVSRVAALRGFTIEAAYAGFMENEVGSITEGKFADFVILDRDIMTIPAAAILDTRVSATFLGGQQVYGE